MGNRARNLMPCENICKAFIELGVSACEGCCRRDRSLPNNCYHHTSPYWLPLKEVHTLIHHFYQEKEV